MKSRKRNRMLGKHYSEDGCYFVTSNCKEHIHYFGRVVNGEIILNVFREIVKQQILWLENQYPYVKFHNGVVMPSHVHILIEIYRGRISSGAGRDLPVPAETPENFNPYKIPEIKIKSISSLIGAFKTTSSKQIHLAVNEDFGWHRSFHNHIVRNSNTFINKDLYIQ